MRLLLANRAKYEVFGLDGPFAMPLRRTGGSESSAFHKHTEYNSPPAPPWRWSGGTLVPAWTCPIPIDLPQTPVFDQPGLSKTLSCGSGAFLIETFDQLHALYETSNSRLGGSTVWGAKLGFGWVAQARETGKGPEPGHRLARDPSGKPSNPSIAKSEEPLRIA
jgi:hypothetical protein